jgi:hypothetical protein
MFEGSAEPKEWRTTDPGFNEVLRAHIVGKKGKPVTEAYFQRILDAVKYWEHSYYEFGPDFDSKLFAKARAKCEKLGIHGFSPGEGGSGDDEY